MENTPFKWFQLPHLIKGLQTSTHILYYNPLLKKVTYGLPGTSYTLPTASGSVLGGVKVGTGLSIDGSGVLSVSSSYTLPVASSTVLGGIKIGSGLSIDGSGVVTASLTETDTIQSVASRGNNFSLNVNSSCNLSVTNTSSGSAAQADFRAYNDVFDIFALGIYSSGTTAYGAIHTRGAFNYSATPGGIALVADNLIGDIRFAAGGNATKMTLYYSGNLEVNSLAGTGSRMVVADATGVLSTQSIPSGGTSYTLPIATASILGGIKVGTNLSINSTTGVLDATYSYTLPIASGSVLGGVKVGTGLSIDGSGVLSATGSGYTLPIASASVLGGIKVGTGLSIDGSGVLSATAGSYTVNNGLNASTSTNFQLGGNLIKSTTISNNTFPLIVSGDVSDTCLSVTNTGASGVRYAVQGTSTSPSGTGVVGTGASTGVQGISSGGTGLLGSGPSVGVQGNSTLGVGGIFSVNPASTNTLIEVLQLQRNTSGTAAAGMGGYINMTAETTTGSPKEAGRLVWKWIDATDATRTSKLEIWTTKNGVAAKVLGIPSEITNYADNAAALAGNLSAGDIYRIGDFSAIVH